jgi:hypothetical protein
MFCTIVILAVVAFLFTNRLLTAPNVLPLSIAKRSESPLVRNLDEYKKIHQKILDGRLPIKVSFNCLRANGYGNHMYTILTGILKIIITSWLLQQ